MAPKQPSKRATEQPIQPALQQPSNPSIANYSPGLTPSSAARMNLLRERHRKASLSRPSHTLASDLRPDVQSPKTPDPFSPFVPRPMALRTRDSPNFGPPRSKPSKIKPLKPDDYETRVMHIKEHERTHPAENFMRRLFRDLDRACAPDYALLEVVELVELVRLARICEVYDEAPLPTQTTYVYRLEHAAKGRGDRAQIAQRALKDLDENEDLTRLRSHTFIQDHGFFTFIVCAHSYYFRRWMAADPGSYGDLPREVRKEVNRLIRENRASIEMFVLSRNLQWKQVVDSHDYFITTFIKILQTPRPDESLNNGTKERRLILNWGYAQRLNDWEYSNRPIDTPMLNLPTTQSQLHPHQYALSLSARAVLNPRVTIPSSRTISGYTTTLVKIITQSFLNPSYTWPNRTRWPTPNDPRYRTNISCRPTCTNCSARLHFPTSTPCNCTVQDLLTDLHSTVPRHGDNPLIELREYDGKGIGVRALQPLYKGDIVGEYVGEIYPNIHLQSIEGVNEGMDRFGQYWDTVGTTYQLGESIAPRGTPTLPSSKPTEGQRVTQATTTSSDLPDDEYHEYTIDATLYANWTRYMNHSCDAAAHFAAVGVGDKILMMVQMKRDVAFGEEVTVNYGPAYWTGVGRKCACQAKGCISGSDLKATEEEEEGEKRKRGAEEEEEEEEEERKSSSIGDTIVVDETLPSATDSEDEIGNTNVVAPWKEDSEEEGKHRSKKLKPASLQLEYSSVTRKLYRR